MRLTQLLTAAACRFANFANSTAIASSDSDEHYFASVSPFSIFTEPGQLSIHSKQSSRINDFHVSGVVRNGVSWFSPGDGTSSVIGSPPAGPATLLPKEYNDSIPSIQTTRVSQDAHGSPSPAPQVVGNGKAIVEALEPAAIAAYPIQYLRPDTVA